LRPNFRKYAILAGEMHDFEEKYMFLKGQIFGNPEISGTLGALDKRPVVALYRIQGHDLINRVLRYYINVYIKFIYGWMEKTFMKFVDNNNRLIKAKYNIK